MDASAEALSQLSKAQAFAADPREQARITSLTAQEHLLAGHAAAALPLLQDVAGACLS